MEIIFLPKAEEDLEFWQKSGNKSVLKKIAQLIESILETPFEKRRSRGKRNRE